MDFELIKAIPLPSVVVAADDRMAAANTAFLGLLPHARIGRSYLTVLRQPPLVSFIEDLRSGVETAPSHLTLNGEHAGSYSATGAMVGEGNVLICIQDMNETAVAIQMRRNFVADLSHELKTPLTAISGILETCDRDHDAVVHFLPTMAGEVERMKRLVDDLLTLSRIEVNERRNPTQTIVLQEVVTKACAPLAILAEKKGIRIDTVLPEDNVCFLGDQGEIVRAIMNIVENALRYGNSGGCVQIVGEINDHTGSTSKVTIEVSDDGPGVESHHIPRLTERFYRIDAHRSRDNGGSGLGLAIVKHIVNRHRGQMTFDSQPNQGSRVTLTFPFGKVAP